LFWLSFSSKANVRTYTRQTNALWTDCSIWTTKGAGDERYIDFQCAVTQRKLDGALHSEINKLQTRSTESAYIRHALGREMGCMREMADALWEGHTLLSAHRHRQTKVNQYIRQFHVVHLTDN